MNLKLSKTSLLLLYLYLMNIITLLGIHIFGYTKSIFLHLILFLLVILLNRVLNNFKTSKINISNFLYFSEICFIIFLTLILIFKDDYFTQYKLLILPSLTLSIFLSFKLEKQY
jgi:CDP-diglyceride synthetase